MLYFANFQSANSEGVRQGEAAPGGSGARQRWAVLRDKPSQAIQIQLGGEGSEAQLPPSWLCFPFERSARAQCTCLKPEIYKIAFIFLIKKATLLWRLNFARGPVPCPAGARVAPHCPGTLLGCPKAESLGLAGKQVPGTGTATSFKLLDALLFVWSKHLIEA